jgi:GNAT superfamily N-acetyltransferase
MVSTWQKGPYTISTDKDRIDLIAVHGFLTRSYWSEGIPLDTVRRALEHSLVFGVYKDDQQVGLARLVTDYTTFAYLADVFVLEPFRGQGLSKWLMEVIVDYPQLQGLRRWVLSTKDAHGLYSKVGYTPLRWPERFMERLFLDVYQRQEASPDQERE